MRPPKPAAKPMTVKPMTMKQALMPPAAVPVPKPKFNPIANLGPHAIPPKGSAPAGKMKALTPRQNAPRRSGAGLRAGLTPAQVAHVQMIVKSMPGKK